jgi:glutathionylspermidine synthase
VAGDTYEMGQSRQLSGDDGSFVDLYRRSIDESWLVGHTPCGLSIREDENPITGNTSRFLPHPIL